MGAIGVLSKLMVARMPESLVSVIYTGRREKSGSFVLDPKAQAVGQLANALRTMDEDPDVNEARDQMRKLVKAFDEPYPPLQRVEDIQVGGAEGMLGARLYSDHSPADGPHPTLVYYHGGGWVQGDLDTHDGICGKLAKWAGIQVIAVDYRLAPEARFPAAPKDAIASFNWIIENAAALNVDPARTGIGGDSAGGNLSAVVCQQNAASGAPVPAYQVLIYPGCDASEDSASMAGMPDAYILPRERMDWYINTYLGDHEDRSDPLLSPGLTADVSNQPKAYVVTCGFDPLRDEGDAYAEKLKSAGVPTVHDQYHGQIHAFISLTKVIPQGNVCIRKMADWIKSAC